MPGITTIGDLVANVAMFAPLGFFVSFAAYLVLSAVWPLGSFGVPWHGGWGFSAGVYRLSQVGILRLLELMAAAVIVGYGMAEARGRRAEGDGRRRWAATATAVVIGSALTLVRGWHRDHGAWWRKPDC